MAKPASGASGVLGRQAFFKLHRNEGFVEATGYMFGYRGVTLFAHREGEVWRVTEGTSGLLVGQGAGTMREAMHSARESVDSIGTERLRERVADSIDRHGSAYLGVPANGIHAQRQAQRQARHSETMERLNREQAQRDARNLARQQARQDRKMAQIREFQARHGLTGTTSAPDDDYLPF